MSKTDPIKNPKDIKRLKNYFLQEGKYRDYAMITLVLNTSIKMESMLKLTWGDIYDYAHQGIKDEILLPSISDDAKNNEGGRAKKIYLNSEVKKAFDIYMDSLESVSPSGYVFKSRVGENKPLGRITVHKMIKKAAAELGIEGNISLQSLKKTLGYQAWEQGYSGEVIMDLYHHPSIAYTKRFLTIADTNEENEETRKLMEKVKL